VGEPGATGVFESEPHDAEITASARIPTRSQDEKTPNRMNEPFIQDFNTAAFDDAQ
jgi:hypothetical protein